MREVVTTDLGKFGSRERFFLSRMLTIWNEEGLPEGFSEEGVRPIMTHGDVFLTNDEGQLVVMGDMSIHIWNVCPCCGHEGFQDECILSDHGCNECKDEE